MRDRRPKCFRVLLALAIALLAALPVQAQDWPTRPVRMIVPFPPRGGSDTVARPLAAKLPVTGTTSKALPVVWHIRRSTEAATRDRRLLAVSGLLTKRKVCAVERGFACRMWAVAHRIPDPAQRQAHAVAMPHRRAMVPAG